MYETSDDQLAIKKALFLDEPVMRFLVGFRKTDEEFVKDLPDPDDIEVPIYVEDLKARITAEDFIIVLKKVTI